jgi:hypothetical protein
LIPEIKMREKNISLLLCHLVGIVTVVMGDLYLHAPRGSNNRLNEKSANRANANRLFDSQVKMLDIYILHIHLHTCELTLPFLVGDSHHLQPYIFNIFS